MSHFVCVCVYPDFLNCSFRGIMELLVTFLGFGFFSMGVYEYVMGSSLKTQN